MLNLNDIEVIREQKPLAIGIIKQLLARHPDSDPGEIAQWLRRHVNTKAYLQNCCQPLAFRYDLNNKAIDIVSPGDSAQAADKIMGRKPPPIKSLAEDVARLNEDAGTLEHHGHRRYETDTSAYFGHAQRVLAAGPAWARRRGMAAAQRPFTLHALSESRWPANTMVGDPDICDSGDGDILGNAEFYVRDNRPHLIIAHLYEDPDLDDASAYMQMLGLAFYEIDNVPKSWYPGLDRTLLIAREGRTFGGVTAC